ncbi:hypothetical protein LCGC14_1385330 [marine sediment metagenome]|uniref:Uncharacterized protein n=1 Tax=marine sediment metagenome TaxID=412755 RepID=A0A0F9KME1_9ZZZZ
MVKRKPAKRRRTRLRTITPAALKKTRPLQAPLRRTPLR